MRSTRLVAGGALVLAGSVWLGQGLGLIGGSFMTGSAAWAAVGGALLVLAVVMLVLEARRRS